MHVCLLPQTSASPRAVRRRRVVSRGQQQAPRPRHLNDTPEEVRHSGWALSTSTSTTLLRTRASPASCDGAALCVLTCDMIGHRFFKRAHRGRVGARDDQPGSRWFLRPTRLLSHPEAYLKVDLHCHALDFCISALTARLSSLAMRGKSSAVADYLPFTRIKPRNMKPLCSSFQLCLPPVTPPLAVADPREQAPNYSSNQPLLCSTVKSYCTPAQLRSNLSLIRIQHLSIIRVHHIHVAYTFILKTHAGPSPTFHQPNHDELRPMHDQHLMHPLKTSSAPPATDPSRYSPPAPPHLSAPSHPCSPSFGCPTGPQAWSPRRTGGTPTLGNHTPGPAEAD